MEQKYKLRDEFLIPVAISVAGVLTYLPAFNNSFISDDFYYLSRIQVAGQNPSHLLALHPGFYRLTGHLYFFLCHMIFGLHPTGYYAVGLLLHLLITYLVFLLVRRASGSNTAALVAALFFVVYERHREAVFWISAVHELLFALSVLLCLHFWRMSLSPGAATARYYALSLIAFAFAQLSKESSVILVPLMIATEFFDTNTQPRRLAVRVLLYVPFTTLTILYALFVAGADPLIAQGFYAVTPHFFPVYGKTLHTLLRFVYIGLFLMLAFSLRGVMWRLLKESRPCWFFAIWILVTPIPYCFLTYLDQIPSRQTYLPSVGTAGIVGMLGAQLYAHMSRRYAKPIGRLLLLLLLAGNMAYVWIKDVQFVRRGQPTRLVIDTLQRDERSAEAKKRKVYVVCDSEGLQVPIRGAIELFTDHDPQTLIFLKNSERGRIEPNGQDHVFQCSAKAEYLTLLR